MNKLIFRALSPLFKVIFGQLRWEPPTWLRALGRIPVALGVLGYRALREAQLRNPRRFWVSLSSLMLVAIVGAEGYRWYKNRPQPYTLKASASSPKATPITVDAKPEALVVTFSGSAAPLELVGKDISTGVTLTPAFAGRWFWRRDSELVFVPAQDWPVGAQFQLTFAPELVASHVLLSEYSLPITTAPFEANFEKAEFYQDPQDPLLKKVVATVKFSHPIDKGDFERKLSLRMRVEPVKSFDDSEATRVGFKVSYDDLGGKAYVHSDPIAIPADNGAMLITVGSDTHSSRGGSGLAQKLERTVSVPGIDTYFRISGVSATAVANKRDEMERIATIETTARTKQQELSERIKVYQLPKDRPAVGDEELQPDYAWYNAAEVTPEILALAKPAAIEWIPTEGEYADAQSFKFRGDTGSYFLVRIAKGLQGFGGYPLAKDYQVTFQAEEFPKLVKVMHEGAILSLSGDKKLSVVTRNVPTIRVKLSRLLPATINHLVSISDGTFQQPSISSYSFGLENLSEVFTEDQTTPIVDPGKNQYVAVDFSRYLRTDAAPRGLFLLEVLALNPETKEPLSGEDSASEEEDGESGEKLSDRRLVLITDLGVVVKDALDGSHDVFVMSMREGLPIADAQVELLGKNGLPLFSGKSNQDGQITLPATTGLVREKSPTVYVVQHNGDLSFLPFERSDRRLNMSRFETGGIFDTDSPEALQAYLFSDRGIYRPGDEIHVGLIVKPVDWHPLPAGLPLELVVTDPRDTEIRREMITFGPDGFSEVVGSTQDGSPTGSYQYSLYVVRDEEKRALLASTTVRVEEFQPDSMTVKAELSTPPAAGWIAPDDLKVGVTLRNLYGTPAPDRKVKAMLSLSPSSAYFAPFADYSFSTPYVAKRSYSEELGELISDSDGHAEYALNLARFEQGTYRLRVVAEGFEAGSGRSVVADASAIVSPAKYLVGYKADGDMSYLKRDAVRKIELIAVDPNLKPIAVDDLKLELFEYRYISTLTKQEDGTFAYQSVRKEIPKGSVPLNIGEAGFSLTLPTGEAGTFTYKLRNSEGVELNQIGFDVIGEANVSRELERNAELKIRLNAKDYAPGQEIELEIQAPYTGAGLITIERDKVYAAKWFKADTTSTVQRIVVPEALEGNGYVSVSFVRAMDSREVFMSPLSYGVVPFSVSKGRRTHSISLDVPELMKPGELLRIGYKTERAAKVVVYAVDEGILQVARYRKPDPLAHFFRKRALEVSTFQILDLLLPEYEIVRSLSATGGDEDADLGKRLNPFKRKGLKPVVLWSGILDSNGEAAAVELPIPDYFNGTVKVFAVAVSADAVGVAESKVVVRGPFVIQPHAPYVVTPGDEFEIGALVANNLEGSGEDAEVHVSLETCPALELQGSGDQIAEISERSEKSIAFQVKVKPLLGPCAFVFTAQSGEVKSSYRLDLSVRPDQPYMTSVTSRYAKKGYFNGNAVELPVEREMYPEMRMLEASASVAPLGLLSGFVHYLESYPHGCSEQIVSQAMPSAILGVRPEFNLDEAKMRAAVKRTLAMLQARQNSEGAFGVWHAGSYVNPYQTTYAAHFLVELREHGFDVPAPLFDRVIRYLKSLVAEKHSSLEELRAASYALYVLSRAGFLMTNEIGSLREQLDKTEPKRWRKDLAGLLLAGTYKLLHLDQEAQSLIAEARMDAPVVTSYRHYYDPTVYRAQLLYILAKHFPERLQTLTAEDLYLMADAISSGESNTMSMGFSVLGLDAYTKAVPAPSAAGVRIFEVARDGSTKQLPLSESLLPHVQLSPSAKAVRFEGDTNLPLFYQFVQTGYDRNPPSSVVKRKLEAFHELKNEKGVPITEIGIDEKVYVHVFVRGTEGEVSDVAVIDMIPGGFEIDISPEGLGSRKSLPSALVTWEPQYVDVREDRVVFYGTAENVARPFIYRLKPTNKGRFKVPPTYAEGMYERSAVARSLGTTIEVKE